MKNLTKLTLLAFLTTVFLNSCSKESKIERNLYKKGGDWEITYYNSVYGSMNPSLNNYSSLEYKDCGKIHFSKDGTGTINYVMSGTNTTNSFKFTNTEKEITFVYDNGASLTYNLKWDKNNIVIDYDHSTIDPDGYDNYDTESIVLVKK